MKYKIHRLEIKIEHEQPKLEEFLNNLEGEVVAIIPNYAKTSLLQIYGISSKINFLLIIEKVK
ncbi:MAG: hypothetical protein RDU14_05140 [Melioribacteraceae bacterium]|nr:hypothetical protein [Melioribacteraceae bacterium]